VFSAVSDSGAVVSHDPDAVRPLVASSHEWIDVTRMLKLVLFPGPHLVSLLRALAPNLADLEVLVESMKIFLELPLPHLPGILTQ